MSGFDPGDGWREVDLRGEGHLHAIYQLAQYDRDSGDLVRAWAQEAPVPPLPIEALAALDGADLIFVSDVLRALGKWKQGRS